MVVTQLRLAFLPVICQPSRRPRERHGNNFLLAALRVIRGLSKGNEKHHSRKPCSTSESSGFACGSASVRRVLNSLATSIVAVPDAVLGAPVVKSGTAQYASREYCMLQKSQPPSQKLRILPQLDHSVGKSAALSDAPNGKRGHRLLMQPPSPHPSPSPPPPRPCNRRDQPVLAQAATTAPSRLSPLLAQLLRPVDLRAWVSPSGSSSGYSPNSFLKPPRSTLPFVQVGQHVEVPPGLVLLQPARQVPPFVVSQRA